jgi:hypothetical protein
MRILFFDTTAAQLSGEAFAVSWIAAELSSGLDDNYMTNYVDAPENFGIFICETALPDKKWIKDNIVPTWKNMKVFKSLKKMRQEFWGILEHLQPQQIWSDSLFPIKSHFLWQVMQENFDINESIIYPFPIYDLVNFADSKIERVAILREIVTEQSGNATGFIEICNEKILLKPSNPLIGCMASMTLFSYLLDKRKIMLNI